MNEENKIGYYAIIPATVLFNENLKANEKLLYAVITALSNKEGYCFASNSYLGDLFNAKAHTISEWVSHLSKLGFVYVDIVRNEKNEIIRRRIYPNDTPYTINKTYPYTINTTEGMSQKPQDNIISINKIDRLFNYIIKKEKQIPNEFENLENQIMDILNKFEMNYTENSLKFMQDNNIEKIKIICYSLAMLVKENVSYLSYKISREKIISLYDDCKLREQEYKNTNNEINSFTNYYYKSLKSELLRNKSSSFFISKNQNIKNESFDSEEDEDEEER